MKVLNSNTLYYRAGSSDKFYTISIVENDDGMCSVPFVYGRRNTSGKSGLKLNGVRYEQAQAMYDKMIREKECKGYAIGPPWMAPDGAPATPADPTPAPSTEEPKTVAPQAAPEILPQLLDVIEEDHVAVGLVADDAFCAQEKHDGKRRLVKYDDGKITGYNRKGKAVGYVETLKNDLTNIANHSGVHQFVIDGEEVGKHFYVFDILELGGNDVRWSTYAARLGKLEGLLSSVETEYVHLVETAFTLQQKKDLFTRLIKGNREGIVFKRIESTFTAGKGHGDWLKFKFYATASFVVAKVNAKRSVALGLYGIAGFVPVGNCTIPPNKDVPEKDSVIEIRYLYAYKGGSLYQPTYLGPRDDVAREECVMDQLKYKAEEA